MQRLDRKTQVDVKVRPARIRDAPFLAWVCLASGRSHCQRGVWDMIINRPEQDCLIFLQQLVTTKTRHTFHYENFIIAEVDRQPAAALSGYDPKELGHSRELRGCLEAGRKVGITLFDWWRNRKNISAIGAMRPHAAPGAWIVESGATRPEYRRLGLEKRLLDEMLETGRQRGFRHAEVLIFIGNTVVQKGLEIRGFRVLDEKRHPHFERETGCPGFRRLVRDL